MPEAGPGTLILVVGPSGAGKDTLIDGACRRFAGRVSAMRRVVTRDPSDAEQHDSLDPAAFADAAAKGRFAFTWQAHGLDYAIPAELDRLLGAGHAVICNVSRTVVPFIRARYPRTVVIYVDAPLPVRRARIVGRRRSGESAGRAGRDGQFAPGQVDILIDNGGALDDGHARFDAAIRRVLDGNYEPLRGSDGKVTLPGNATE